eukprot:11132477-Alexandrium_andersonii.AAC.1
MAPSRPRAPGCRLFAPPRCATKPPAPRGAEGPATTSASGRPTSPSSPSSSASGESSNAGRSPEPRGRNGQRPAPGAAPHALPTGRG